MNINAHYIYIRSNLFVLLLALFFLQTACQSNDTGISSATVPESSIYVSRPKIILETPMAKLPYTLTWEGSNAVRSYEIQSALDPDFTQSRQNWTTKESFLLIKELKGDRVYFRIRSRFEEDFSRWSEILQISKQNEGIRLTRIRN